MDCLLNATLAPRLEPSTERRRECLASVLFAPRFVTAALERQVLEMGDVFAKQVATPHDECQSRK